MDMGNKLRQLAQPGQPAQVAGVINPYCALLAQRAGVPAGYVSGGATAACLGMPDLGVLNLADMADLAARITAAGDWPLLVDADTGFGNELAIGRTVRTLERVGVAGLHIEDQVADKRCGHRPGKVLCPAAEMGDRIKAACDARLNDTLVIMARTDAIGVNGLDDALERAAVYIAAGADMVFLEGATDSAQYGAATAALAVPVLANMTEFGVTPLMDLAELAAQGIALALYPLTAFRVMMRAAEDTYRELGIRGGQAGILDRMQTRQELYEHLGYDALERKLNARLHNV